MRAEGGHIFNNTVLDHNGAVVCLNVALDYMFSQAASTALRGENWPDSFRGKPYIFFVVVCCNRAALNFLHCEMSQLLFWHYSSNLLYPLEVGNAK